MKQYLNETQTAKLIELGFEKPRIAAPSLKWVEGEPTFEPQYTIGELLSFLPLSFKNNDYYALTIRRSKVMYSDPYLDWIEAEWVKHEELIDNLFDACVELKEEEVI